MIGGLILLVGFGYFVLSKYIIKNTYEKYGTKKAKYIATAIMVLIPTWDIVLGYPIYAYLCKFESGVKIYQTVENVEGFYVGERDANYPYPPYEGYRYMDYKGEKSDKYYRNSWIDNNTSELCIPVGKHLYSDYAKAFKQGRCIAREEIAESDVSLLIDIEKKIRHTQILYLDIYRVEFLMTDRNTHKQYMQIVDYFVNESWITGATNIVSGNTSTMNCNKNIINTSSGFEINRKHIINYLTKGDN